MPQPSGRERGGRCKEGGAGVLPVLGDGEETSLIMILNAWPAGRNPLLTVPTHEKICSLQISRLPVAKWE